MYPYVYLDGIYLKKNWGGTIENIAVLVALGVNEAGNREIIGAAEGGKEDKGSWLNFLRSLKERGLKGVRLMVGDKCLGLIEAIKEVYPEAAYQRCMASISSILNERFVPLCSKSIPFVSRMNRTIVAFISSAFCSSS